MKLPYFLNPWSVFRELDAIDREPPSFTAPREQTPRVALIVLFTACLSLLILNYCKNYVVLEQLLVHWARLQQLPAESFIASFRQSPWFQLLNLAWWGGWHLLTYVLLPAIVIRRFLGGRVVDFGLRWGETHKHWRGYALLLSPILCFVVLVSFREDFVHHYPFYGQAGRSWFDFLAWEFIYLGQFACLEFFYRGFFIHALRPHFGSAAIWIMVVPYLMIHFPKPWLEATGAIFFGLFLGMLALRSRSIWGGFLVHAGVAVSMDLASLVQRGQIPTVFWPEF